MFRYILTYIPAGEVAQSPLGSVDVLNAYETVLSCRFQASSSELSFNGIARAIVVMLILTIGSVSNYLHLDLLPMFDWLFCYLWKESYDKFSSELKSGKVLDF